MAEKGPRMRVIQAVFLVIATLCFKDALADLLTENNKSDPLPPFSSFDPYVFLYRRERQRMKGDPGEYPCNELFSVSVSAFGQTASAGRNAVNSVTPIGPTATGQPGQPFCGDLPGCTELGDLGGKWDMIALLFGPLPNGQTLPPTLATARAVLFPNIPAGTPINDSRYIDITQHIGFFTIPLRYKKKGVRGRLEVALLHDVGLVAELGVSDICQAPVAFTNLTCTPCSDTTNPATCCGSLVLPEAPNPFNKQNINDYLMNELPQIAPEIGLDIGVFHKVSIEDLRLNLYWRKAYEVNRGCKKWSSALIIPFLSVGGSIATSDDRDLKYAFGLPFSNDGHHSVGFTVGLNIDFFDTIEIGGSGGLTHFFEHDVCKMRIPTSSFQSGIYPFTTDAQIKPGDNWHFGLKMNAYHFIDRLSFYFQYQIVQHKDDHIELQEPDPAFLPHQLERISTWKSQMINSALNYDISPNVSIGFLWQAPVSQRNAYRSTTVMFSFRATF